MAVYKFNMDLKGRIEPLPGDTVELGGVRLKVVGDGTSGNPTEGCCNCVLDDIACHLGINQMLMDRLCMRTTCTGKIREDKTDIHYEEVKEVKMERQLERIKEENNG